MWFIATLAMSASACSQASSPDNLANEDCALPQDQMGHFAKIPDGSFMKGASPLYQEERPSLRLQVKGFLIQTHEVTNAQFAAFVEDTGYLTDAERSVLEKREGAGSAVFLHSSDRGAATSPWALMPDASWRSPEGQGSSIEDRENEPVVHVSKNDVEAYAVWAGGRLPSEVEWEYAASLGLPDPDNQTSGAYGEDGPRANTWQGVFPVADLGTDGYNGTAPVGCFGADRLGLYDMIGNVWEWTDTSYGTGTHTIKGGSYLCADNFCRRYRPAARQPQDTDFSSNHIGFRIVRDLPPANAGSED
ncbi:MAG: formylglycine-generating enzyme family protein [Henriciella sp.]|nr:formylglycine-generating enzyme family protein [Henriciella sp.]